IQQAWMAGASPATTTEKPNVSASVRRPLALTLAFLLLRIRVYQRADHALVGHTTLASGPLEESHRTLRQAQRHLHIVLAKHQSVRGRQKILDNPDAADLALAIFMRWLFHRSPFLSSNNPPRKS